MPIAPKRWNIRPVCPADHLTRFSHLPRLLAQILYNRGVTDPEDVAAFLESRLRFDDPYQLAGMDRAVFAVQKAVKADVPICVYGDFDADGVTATALLVTALEALGARVFHYIPHRIDEGYGLHREALDKVCGLGAKLVITVDCGIRSVDEVDYGRRTLNMGMIVTDHHDPGDELPPAYAVINPKQQGCRFGARFKGLAGVGIAFKLSQALLRAAKAEGRQVSLLDEDLYDLVALGTVADVAPLLHDNRYLVQRGLERLRLATRPGVFAMMSEAKLSPQRVDATAIGFILGPRLNAAGRLDTAETSYELLTCREPARATELAARVGELNRQRQTETQSLVSRVRAQFADRPGGYVYVAAGRDYRRGVVGLAAGRLCEELYRPVLVAELNGENAYGSARSIPEFNITAALDRIHAEAPSLLVRYGGHDVAAGFTAPADGLPELQERLEALGVSQLAGQELSPVLEIDAEVRLGDLDYAVQELLAQLEPCGQDNRQPVLCSRGLIVAAQRLVGSEQSHLKLTLRDPNPGGRGGGLSWDAIAFRQGEWYNHLPERIDAAFVLEVNEYQGERRLQLNIKDIRPATGNA